ncbi:MAG TPA: hypothetical protein VKZ96_02220, partial [Thermomicrobiales bacterium]|nr:hypothetical protein [Thermomicrobiales bacterium]
MSDSHNARGDRRGIDGVLEQPQSRRTLVRGLVGGAIASAAALVLPGASRAQQAGEDEGRSLAQAEEAITFCVNRYTGQVRYS